MRAKAEKERDLRFIFRTNNAFTRAFFYRFARLNSRLRKREIFAYLFAFCVLFSISIAAANAQDLPDKIRGYKVHRARISVQTGYGESKERHDTEATVKIGEPKISDFSISGATIELPIEFAANEQSGTIDFLSFYDFKANDLSIEVEEYKESFAFKKKETIALPKPLKIFVPLTQALRGAAKELTDSKDEWLITGRVFVFGRFKKSVFKFKRVVPVEINVKIKNPIKNN